MTCCLRCLWACGSSYSGHAQWPLPLPSIAPASLRSRLRTLPSLSQTSQKLVPQLAHNRPEYCQQVLLSSFHPEGGNWVSGHFLCAMLRLGKDEGNAMAGPMVWMWLFLNWVFGWCRSDWFPELYKIISAWGLLPASVREGGPEPSSLLMCIIFHSETVVSMQIRV